MSVREISVNNVERFLSVGYFPLIHIYKKGAVKESMLPLPVNLKDNLTGKIYNCQLISCFGFENFIPEVCAFMCEKKKPDIIEKELFERFKISSINQLGFYLYEIKN